jgi:hypothetical protein
MARLAIDNYKVTVLIKKSGMPELALSVPHKTEIFLSFS